MFEFWNDPTAVHAYYLSLVSLILTLGAAIMGLVLYVKLDDSLLFVYGLENCIDFLSSAIVVWRFNNPNKPRSNSEQNGGATRLAVLEAREKRASVAISFILVVLGFCAVIVACVDMKHGGEEISDKNLWLLYYIAFFSILCFGGMGIFKFRYAAVLQSPSLQKDGMCSLLGAVLALSLFFNSVLSLSTDGKLWWLDPAVAFICGIVCLIYGLYSLYIPFVVEGLPIFRLQWWTYASKERTQTTAPTGVDGGAGIAVQNGGHDDDDEDGTVVARGDGGSRFMNSTVNDDSTPPPPSPPPMNAFESGVQVTAEKPSDTAAEKVNITDVDLT